MSEHFVVGDHVWANFANGKELAHVTAGAHENAAGETKYGVQDSLGKTHELGYREPEDDDEHGSGGTFWKI
jgi:hypothetical protein